MKTLPRFSLNQFYKILAGTALLYPLLSPAQDTPLATPSKTEYPGIIQTFEKLIQIDGDKFQKRSDILLKNGKVFSGSSSVTNLDLEPDFLNSVILHSDPGYLRLASSDKCRFYDTILTDLLRSAEGKIKNVLITYVEKDTRQSALISRKDFLTKVVTQECPETQKNIAAFQVKTLQETLKGINFDIPTGVDQCRNIHINWLNNPKTPYLCQLYEFTREAKLGGGDPKDLEQRRAVAKIITDKMSLVQEDYIENLCKHLDDEDLFCEEFLNVSFWTKIAGGYESKTYAEDICAIVMNAPTLSPQQYAIFLARLKKEKDLCLYPANRNPGLRPQPDCDQLSTALNHSALKADYKDCPGNSDQLIVTNMSRIINQYSATDISPAQGPCQSLTASTVFNWNKGLDNDANWKIEACYEDKIAEKEVCTKTFFGKNPLVPESYTNVVASILKKTRGADNSVTCDMVDSGSYNPGLLQYKSGCWIVYEKENCYISQCKHKVIFNDRPIDIIKIKGSANLAYFPLTVRDERFSQNYILNNDFKKGGRQMSSLNSVSAYFKRSRTNLLHGVGCAEDLLPTFFKTFAINQCTPMPFIINGMIKDKDKFVLVVRTAADSLQAPRLMSWSTIYSGVKSYQKIHPLKLWTLYGMD